MAATVTFNDPDESFPDGRIQFTTAGGAGGDDYLETLTVNPPYHIHQDDDFLTAWQEIATAMTELATISTQLKGYTESIKNDITVFKTLGTTADRGIVTQQVVVNNGCNGGALQPAVIINALRDAGTLEDVLKEMGDPLYMPSGERQSDKDAKA